MVSLRPFSVILLRLFFLTFLLTPWSAGAAIQARPQPVVATDTPRVRLIATGGTISNKTEGRLTADELLARIPDVTRWARPEAEQFANQSSGEMTLDQWLRLAKRINTLLEGDRELAGIVVTSGTDTLEELAYFLDLSVRSERPVVVVGSMRNPSTLGYEGAANLEAGFRVVAAPAARERGVLVVLNDEINAARDVTKTDAHRLQTFQSRGYGILGVVDADRIVFYRDVVKRHTMRSEFDLATTPALPRVDVLMVYQDAPADLIKAAVDHGAKGIVIAAAGAGATSGTQDEGIEYATAKGVFVVITTRTGSGRIAARLRTAGPRPTASGRRSDYQIAGEDLAPVKARILLMVALTKTQDPIDIQRIFTEY